MTTQEKLTKIEEVIREVCDIKEMYWMQYEHEIHLEHILRAGNFCISSSGKIFDGDINVPTGHTYTFMPDDAVIYYDLTKPYHLQSDEFISWLYGVLVRE